MQRLVVVYNPNSSRYATVKKEVPMRLKDLPGYIIAKYEVKKTTFEENVKNIAKLLKDDDIVVAAGGDGTASIMVNGVIKSGKDVKVAALPYGNFNDLARTLKFNQFDDIFKVSLRFLKYYPLEIWVNGKFWRYAPCYTTIGMVAEACEIFDKREIRKELQRDRFNKWLPYVQMARWYFKNRKKREFMAEFTLNGKKQRRGTSDYAAVNSASMARVMRGRSDYKKPKVFRSETDKLTSFPRLFVMMTRSIFYRVPGADTKGDIIEFKEPASVEIQAEGEYKKFEKVRKIEIKKGEKWVKMLSN